jgi:hypothetical protein
MSVLQVKNNLRSRRNLVARRQGGELHRAANDERVWSDEEGIGAPRRKACKNRYCSVNKYLNVERKTI